MDTPIPDPNTTLTCGGVAESLKEGVCVYCCGQARAVTWCLTHVQKDKISRA